MEHFVPGLYLELMISGETLEFVRNSVNFPDVGVHAYSLAVGTKAWYRIGWSMELTFSTE